MIDIPLTATFDLDPDAVIAGVKAQPQTKLLFLCTPNNPTGNAVDPADILRIDL